jgi:glycosyltransferase involved in cell wall biosynthesis
MTAIPPLFLVVVTPIYEDVEASSKLFKELKKALGSDVYVVAVDDGSVKQPVDIESLQATGLDGVVIQLKRNVGHQRAIAIGLKYVGDHLPNASHVVVMDSDGEDLPETINALIESLARPDIDVVVAQRKSRVETLRFRTFYVVYKWLFQLLSGHKINFGNFMALKPNAVKRMAAMQELWIHVAGCVLTSKLRIATCSLDRGPRYAGQSKMNFVGLALHGFKGLMVFAEDVLVRVGIACAFIAAFSVIGVLAAIILKIFGIATPGWFSIALGILVLVFLQTGALTLMTLMLTGAVKGGAVSPADYNLFIDRVLHAKSETTR